jgi:excisionase family DNA binding protein
MTGDGLMTVKDVAVYLRVSVSKVYHMISGRRLPYVKIGAAVRCRRRDLDRFVLQNLHGRDVLNNGHNGRDEEPGLQ